MDGGIPAVLVEACGFCAAIMAFVMLLPQAIKIVRLRNDPDGMKGVSLATEWLIVVNSALWIGYAIGMHAWFSGVPSAVNGPVAILVLAVVFRARRRAGACAPAAPQPRAA
jgi:uncharacterized protein with PQ loop repeat